MSADNSCEYFVSRKNYAPSYPKSINSLIKVTHDGSKFYLYAVCQLLITMPLVFIEHNFRWRSDKNK